MSSPNIATAFLWPVRDVWCFLVLHGERDEADFAPTALEANKEIFAASRRLGCPLTRLLLFRPSEVPCA